MPPPRRRRSPGPRPYTLFGYDLDTDYDECEFVPPEEIRRYQESEMTTRDVAQKLGVRQATVRRWVARGYLKPIRRHGPSHVFRTGDVLEANRQIDSRRKGTGKAAGGSRYRVDRRPIDLVPAKHWEARITIDEAAKLIRVSPATIRSWIHRGHLATLPSSTRRAVWLRVGDVIRTAHDRRPTPPRGRRHGIRAGSA